MTSASNGTPAAIPVGWVGLDPGERRSDRHDNVYELLNELRVQ